MKRILYALALSIMAVAFLDGWERAGIALAVLASVACLVVAALLPPDRPRTQRLVTRPERHRGRWFPGFGVFLRVPFIPFLSVGLWRWRGRR